MKNSHLNENLYPMLSLERAEEILRNVYQAAGISPPDHCGDILRRGKQAGIGKLRSEQSFSQ